MCYATNDGAGNAPTKNSESVQCLFSSKKVGDKYNKDTGKNLEHNQ